MGAPSVDIFIG